jgi:CHAD domain-containing protein
MKDMRWFMFASLVNPGNTAYDNKASNRPNLDQIDGKQVMTTPLVDKWVEASAGDRTSEVCARTLRGRLGAVLHFLPLAAKKSEKDIEQVHQLRVWSRRATAALGMYEDFLPRRRSAWMKKQLKRVRRAANEARDCDVLLGRLQKKKQPGRAAKHWLAALRAERRDAQKAIVAVYRRLARGKCFARRIDKLLERIRPRRGESVAPTDVSFGDWARQRLGSVVEGFLSGIPEDRKDEAALHQLRIRGKELRYAVELLAGAFPNELRTKIYPILGEMQDRLGRINDLATAKTRLQEKIEAARNTNEAASWCRLLMKEQIRIDQALGEFWPWCFSQIRQIRERFMAILDQLPPNTVSRTKTSFSSVPTTKAATVADGSGLNGTSSDHPKSH